FLRCLIDKVVAHRSAPDTLQVRIVWRGGGTTTAQLPGTGGALARRARAAGMGEQIPAATPKGNADGGGPAPPTGPRACPPKHTTVLPSTVRILRLRHRLFRKRSQSHPRHIPGCLTVSQVARKLGITPHWIYDRIHNGTIAMKRDRDTNLYLFPDEPRTITLLKQLRAGKLQKLRF